jgi:Transglutaminase-like superfamily
MSRLRTVARADPAVLAGAAWAVIAVRGVRRDLRRRPVDDARVPAPPPLPARARRGVDAVLRRLEPSCLERALVLQRWLAARGEPRDVVIGVTAPSDFRAHAWLEGESGPGFTEISRVRP